MKEDLDRRIAAPGKENIERLPARSAIGHVERAGEIGLRCSGARTPTRMKLADVCNVGGRVVFALKIGLREAAIDALGHNVSSYFLVSAALRRRSRTSLGVA